MNALFHRRTLLNGTLALALAGAGTATVVADLVVVPDETPQALFCGQARPVRVAFHNPADKPVEVEIRVRLFQTASSTAAQTDSLPWKSIVAQPGQTILETAELAFPEVKARTSFLIQWIERTNRILGSTFVLVYPTNLVRGIGELAGAAPLGLLDPAGQVRTVLRAHGVSFDDLGKVELDAFAGKLAIVISRSALEQREDSLTDRVRKLALKGAAIVWIVPAEDQTVRLKPSYYTVPVGRGTVVVAQPGLISDFTNNPVSQLNLVRLATTALEPAPAILPEASQTGD